MRIRRMLGFVVLTMAAWAVPAGVAVAGKPSSGGGVDTGTIYYSLSGQVWRMDPDGSGKAALPVYGQELQFDASRALHGGHRWFLGRTVFAGHYELTATRDDGVVVRMTSTGSDVSIQIPTWGPGDSRIAWFAARSTGSGVVGDGYYVADVAYDGAGAPTGLVSQPTSPAVAPGSTNSSGGYDWSPDGTRLVISDWGSDALRIADVATGTWSSFVPAGAGANVTNLQPSWSPDGGSIAYASIDGIRVVGPDGSGDRLAVANPGNQRSTAFYARPHWSPNGVNLLFGLFSTYFVPYRADVARSTPTGGSVTNLTSDVNPRALIQLFPVAWR